MIGKGEKIRWGEKMAAAAVEGGHRLVEEEKGKEKGPRLMKFFLQGLKLMQKVHVDNLHLTRRPRGLVTGQN